MSKITAPVVKVTLDRERSLLLDLNAMAEFEEYTGKSFLSVSSLTDMGMKDLRALLWACLIHEDENLTVKQVGAMVHSENMNRISDAIVKAFSMAMPEPNGDNPPLTKSRPAG